MTLGLELHELERVALVHVRQAALVVVGGSSVVAALLVGGEEAAERDDGARRAELGVLAGVTTSRRCAATRLACASFICDAIVRIQISS